MLDDSVTSYKQISAVAALGFQDDESAFPFLMYDLLEDAERLGFDNIVSWLTDGSGFMVHDRENFTKHILPTYFKQSRYKSFQRQLNFYSFDRLKYGLHAGSYFQPHFRRGARKLCHLITRCTSPSPSTVKSRTIKSTTKKPLIVTTPQTREVGTPLQGKPDFPLSQVYESRDSLISAFPESSLSSIQLSAHFDGESKEGHCHCELEMRPMDQPQPEVSCMEELIFACSPRKPNRMGGLDAIGPVLQTAFTPAYQNAEAEHILPQHLGPSKTDSDVVDEIIATFKCKVSSIWQ